MLMQLTLQHRLIAIFLLSILTMLIGYLFLLKPQYRLLEIQRKQIMQLNEQIKNSAENLQQWQQLRGKFLPLLRFRDQHALLELINDQAEVNGVSLLSIRPVGKPMKQSEMSEIVQMDARANFFSLIAWLQALDQQGLPFALTALTIVPGADQQTLWLEIKLSMQVSRPELPQN